MTKQLFVLSLALILQIHRILAFQFASLSVNAESKVINTLTTYQIDFDRSKDDNLAGTAWATVMIKSTDTATVTFPAPYVLTTVTCIASVNAGSQFSPSCGVVGGKVVISNLVTTNTAVSSLSVWISNILNPAPAITTDYFTGTIGSDTSGPGTFASNIILQPGSFSSCYSTFNPTTVNSTSNMQITLTPKNSIPSNGYVIIGFPIGRRWTNDLSTNNFMPFATTMSCSNLSANVLSNLGCAGSTTQATVTVTNMFSNTISSSFSFSINNFLSPPTNQQSDALTATSYYSTGQKIDTCTFYVSDLTPKPLTSIFITNNIGNGSLTVNLFYTLRFTFTLTDTLAQTDTLTVVFPTGSVVSFSSGTVTSTFGSGITSTSFQPASLTLFVTFTSIGRTFASGTVLSFSVGSYQAPPSIETSSTFLVTFYRNNFKKLQGTATVTAIQSTLTGSVTSIVSTTVNANTSYTFQLTLSDSISSSGKIKLTFPSTISILASTASCATVSGTNTTTVPTCSYNYTQNSITLSNLNASSANIGPQSMSVTIVGLKNPDSIKTTGVFRVNTYYKSNDGSLVASGTITGITATTAVIGNAAISLTASSLIVNDISTTNSLQYKVDHPIPTGGYFTIFIPSDITIDTASLPNSCSININSTSFVSTACAVASATGGSLVTFSNPLAVDATLNTIILARISSVFTNPSSTRPTQTFKFYTYHSDGFAIAFIDTALTIQMNTPTTFDTISVARVSNKNYDITTYTFSISQKSVFEASSVILVTFPSNIAIANTPVCSLTVPTTTVITCSYSGSTLKVNLPATIYASTTLLKFTSTNIRNPPSFQPAGTFTFQSKTANQLYTYSLQTHTPALTNTIPTTFQSITYQFTPAVYGEPVSLRINFTLTNSKIPAKIRLTLANSFTVGTLACNSFVDFVGACTILGSTINTIEVTGNFSNAPMAFSVTGITTPTMAPLDYSSMVTFDSNDYKIDQSSSAIKFSVVCTMPCRTCQSITLLTSCTSCYSSTAITNMIYFDSILKNCYSTCPSGKYAETSTKTCNPCDANCLTCSNSPIYCLSCDITSSFKYLYLNTSATPNTQTCVSACPSQMYADSTNSNICTACVSPCLTCTSATSCLSCISGRYLLGTSCGTTCPNGLYIANPTTNFCDPCHSSCATCQSITTNCTSCNTPSLLYQSQCLTQCPTPLVPQSGTCGPCDSNCLTCSKTPFNCTSCDTGSSLAYLLNNVCLAVCPEEYYKNIGLGVCSLCSGVTGLNCNNCSSVSTCYTCNTGFVLFNETCINYVPTGYVNISGVAQPCIGDCATCSITTSNCTSCKSYNLLTNTCYQICPSGYIGISKICQPCTSPCKTCSNSQTNCTSCDSALIPSVYLSNFVCVTVCPDSTYASNSNNTCMACVSPCQFCTSAATCLSCLNNFFLLNSSCLTSCPSGYAGVNRQCKICEGNCATCINETTLCLTCKPNTYLFQLNNSCVTSCGNGLYVDPLTQKCIYCVAPCKTCQNTSTTCLSCLTGSLYNNQCLSVCPNKTFDQSGFCTNCPTSCSACTSLTSCNSCVTSYVLYNGFCISNCPATHAVVISQVCTLCSGSSCHQCTSADVCTMCDSQFSLLKGACLGTCPSGYKTNGTHCIDITQQSLTTSTSFPVPFSIAATVLIIACLMSKLQFSRTFLPGAVYAFIGLLQAGALAFFLGLYYGSFFSGEPLPFYVGIAALAYLMVLNIFAFIIQNIIFCSDKLYQQWQAHTPNKCSSYITNIISIVVCHKFRNILFSKLFTFAIFTSQLQSVSKFKVINIFSFLSLIHSGAAIFAVSVGIGFTQSGTQVYYECIDVIVVTGLNAILAFFNVMKPHDFFYEMTPEGFQLKKKINDGETYHDSHGKIMPAGNQIQNQQGYTSNIYHVSQGNLSKQQLLNTGITGFNSTKTFQKTKYNPYQIQQIPDQSYGSLVDPQIKLQDMSIQAVDMIDDTLFEDPQQNFDITAIPPPGHQKIQESSNYTTIFNKSDKGVGVSRYQNSQIGIQNTIDHGPSIRDVSIQQTAKKLVDQSVQRYSQFDPVDRSVQKTVFFRQDQSIQYAQSMKSKPPSMRDQSVSNYKVSMKDKSIQQIKSQSNKSLMYQPSMHDIQVQKSTIQKIDQQVQNIPQTQQQQIQAVQQQSQKGNQKQVSQTSKSIQFAHSNRDKSVQHQNQIQYSQYNQDIQPSKTTINAENPTNQDKIIQQFTMQEQSPRNKQLKQNERDQFLLPKEEIRSYQEELEQRIRDKEKELGEIRRKVEKQERRNIQRARNKPSFVDNTGKNLISGGSKEGDDREASFTNSASNTNNNRNNSMQIPNNSPTKPPIPNFTKKPSPPTQNPSLAPTPAPPSSNHNTQTLKKQSKQIQQEPDAEIDPTIEQIEVINDEGEVRKIKAENREGRLSRESKATEEEFLGMMEEDTGKVIFQNSQEGESQGRGDVGNDGVSWREGRSKKLDRNQPQYEQESNIMIKQNSQAEADKSKSFTNRSNQNRLANISSHAQFPTQSPKKPLNIKYIQSQAQISSQKDGSTKIYSSRPMNHKRVNSTRQPNQNPSHNLQDSSDYSIDQIVYKPIEAFKPHSFSEMSGTIEEMQGYVEGGSGSGNAIGRSRSKDLNGDRVRGNSKEMQSYLGNQQIKNKIRESLGNNMKSRLRKQIPSDRKQQLNRHRFQPYSSNTPISAPAPKFSQQNPGPTPQPPARKSSLLLAGRSQFQQPSLARRQSNNNSPLKTAKRWQFQNDDKNIEESGGEQHVQNTRSNLAHYVNPIETDKSVLEFKTSRVGHENYGRDREKKIVVDQISPFIGQISHSQLPNKPKFQLQVQRKDLSSQMSLDYKNYYGTSNPYKPRPYQVSQTESLQNPNQSEAQHQQQQQPYIEQSDYTSSYKNQIMLGQMLSRPDNGEMKNYYNYKGKGKNKSKGKSRDDDIEFLSETQKIYRQRIGDGRRR